jgi:hypothetical protein
MAGQGGPDEETWKKMTPAERRAYWIAMGLIVAVIGGLALIRLLR